MSYFSQEIRKRAFKRAEQYACVTNNEDAEMLKVNEEENDVKRGKPKQMENCKSRLALLATEINQWEDDVASTKVKGKNDAQDVKTVAGGSTAKVVQSVYCENKENNFSPTFNNRIHDNSNNSSSGSRNTSRSKQTGNLEVVKDEGIDKKKVELRSSFVSRLEAQGFYKTEHNQLICDLNKSKSDKSPTVRKTTTIDDSKAKDVLKSDGGKLPPMTKCDGIASSSTVATSSSNNSGRTVVKSRISNAGKSSSGVCQNKNSVSAGKTFDNNNNNNKKRLRHDSRRATRFSFGKLNGKDPCQLTVKERMKLFETGQATKNVATAASAKKEAKLNLSTKCKSQSKDLPPKQQTEDIIECDEKNEPAVLSFKPKVVNLTAKQSPHTPKQNSDALEVNCVGSAHTPEMLSTVVFSTPLPNHIPPVEKADTHDCILSRESDDISVTSLESSENSEGSKNLDSDTSFGQEILMATKDIISSYSTTKDFDASERTQMNGINSLGQLSELYSGRESVSPSPPKRSRESSNVTGEDVSEESSSFTYINRSSSDDSLKELAKCLEQSDSSNNDDGKPGTSYSSKTMEFNVRRKIAGLNEMLIREKTVTLQAMRALKLCTSNSAHLNSEAHTEACKVLLLSNQRFIAIQQELDRLTVENAIHDSKSEKSVSKGNITISDIKLPIKVEMLQEDSRNGLNNYLLCLVKYKENVYASNVVLLNKNTITRDGAINKFSVQFSNKFLLSDIYSDFKITVELYSMTTEGYIVKQEKKGHKFKNSVKKQNKEQCNSSNNTPQKATQQSNNIHPFTNIGSIIFSIDEVNRTQFMLTQKQQSYDLLVGNVQMKITCSPIIICEHNGFLTMYEVITGFGAWSRYWFNQRGTTLLYWKYPDQEQTQAPINSLDLKECITKSVDTVGIEICARPHTFMLEFEHSKGNIKRYLLSADNSEERIEWYKNLNNILRTFQTWRNN